jgi:prefoldin beta subunit
VYKLVGPLLVKQDLVEARANVGKRLEFITSERCLLPWALKAARVNKCSLRKAR